MNFHILQTLMNFQFLKYEGWMFKEKPTLPVTTAFICASKGRMYDLAAHSSCPSPLKFSPKAGGWWREVEGKGKNEKLRKSREAQSSGEGRGKGRTLSNSTQCSKLVQVQKGPMGKRAYPLFSPLYPRDHHKRDFYFICYTI